MTETDQSRKNKGKRAFKIILLIFPMLCICTGIIVLTGFKDAFVLDQEKVRDLASQISDYDLPDGFENRWGSSIYGSTTVLITDNKTSIVLSQAPLEGLLPDPKDYVNCFVIPEPICSAMGSSIVLKEVDTKLYTIRGYKSNLIVFDGQSKYHHVHQWAARFMGKGGYAQIIIFALQENWDETIAENYLNSLR
jgi:hypothetical protein